MVIRASAAREIGRLLTDLEGGSAVQQEVAIARLAFIGPRAVEQLLSLLDRAPTGDVRASTLRALEAIGDGRALMPAVAALGDPHEAVGTAAVGVVRSHLLSEDGEAAATALDRLTALALDATGIDALRLAAIDALTDMPRDVVAPVLAHLQSDTNAPIRRRAEAASGDRSTEVTPPTSVVAAARGALPEDPAVLRALVTTEAPSIPLATLHRLLGVIKEREDREKGSARIEWMAARAAVHRILAARGSRVALYELRETLAAARRPLPIGFLVAVSAVGDASCLDALAAAYAHASPSRGDWWREHLKDAFQLITRRSRLTRRHRVIKRIADRWPDIAEELIPHRQPTATPRRKPRRAVASLRR